MYFNKLMKGETFNIVSDNWNYAHEHSDLKGWKNISHKEVCSSHSLFSRAAFRPGQLCFYFCLVSCDKQDKDNWTCVMIPSLASFS